jgi:transposase
MSLAPALAVREGDRTRLADLARLPSVPSGLAKRARIVLLAADGMPNAQIARAVGVSRPTVICWRDRYAAGGIRALDDEPRSGRPPVIDEIDVVVATLANDGRPPERLAITHWSARFLAAELGISFASVARIWRKWNIRPHRIQAFTFGTDPELEFKIRDVVGLYLHPPENAVVVSTDGKHRIRALDRTQLLTALKAGTGKITAGACCPGHCRQEFRTFLTTVAAAHPGVELHVVCDSRLAWVRTWLQENERVTPHFTPPGRSWLNMAEIFFGITARQATRCGTLRSVRDLTAAIGRFTDAYDDRCQPFAWTRGRRS